MLASAITALSIVFATGSTAAETDVPRPRSVVLIGVDTLRADHLGLYGAKRATSPMLDRLAKNARVFDHAYATSAWTLPSFASVLTGLDPAEHGAGILLRNTPGVDWGEERIGRKKRTKLDPKVRTLAERLSEAGFATFALVQSPNLDPSFDLGRGFDSYSSNRRGGKLRARAAVDQALVLIDAQKGRPFFLFLHLIDPHLNYDAPAPAGGMFTDEIEAGLKRPVSDIIKLRRAYPTYPPVKKQFVEAAYDEEIAFVDLQIDRLFRGLAKRGLDAETLVILTSDHGEEFFEHGAFEHGHSLYQEVVRVPFLVWGPGVASGRESAPVSIADATPTILDALRLEVPKKSSGRSLWPVLSGRDEGDPLRLIVASGTLWGSEQRMAMRWPFKLIHHVNDDKLLLFDLEKDPNETNDLSAARSELAGRLVSELNARIRKAENDVRREAIELSDEVSRELRELGYLE